MENLSLRLPTNVIEWAKEESKLLGVPKSTFIKLIIVEAYNNNSSKKIVKNSLNI